MLDQPRQVIGRYYSNFDKNVSLNKGTAMKYWVVSANVDNSQKTLEEWVSYIRAKKIAVMGWNDQKWHGKTFKDKISLGDMIIVAQGSNVNKRLCLAGIVTSEALAGKLENPHGQYDFYRDLSPAIELKDDPTAYGLSFKGAAFGESQRLPSLYQLYPERNEADRLIVAKMHELLNLPLELTDEKEDDEIVNLIDEFKRSFLDAGDGEYHRKLLVEGRDQGRKNYQAVLDLKQDGKDITDAVLYGLLPHVDTQNNREKKHWIHIAPSVTKDIKEWFEGAGWIKKEDWPDVAEYLFEFIRKAIDNPTNFQSICDEFESGVSYKGFQVGMLSPILNALDPEHYLVVNAKPISVINMLSGTQYKARIKELPEIIESIRQWVDENRGLLEPITPKGLTVYDTFDIFCHWLKGVKKYQKLDSRYVRYGRGSDDAARKVFAKIFPDDSVRKSAEEFLGECIERAHEKNSNSWEITLGPRYIMFNVGFVKVLRLHFKETRIYLLGSAFTPELREKYADIIEFSDDFFKSLKEEAGICRIAPSKFAEIISDLKYAVYQFIDVNATRSKSSVWAASHSPGVITYLRSSLQKELPSPDYENEVIDDPDNDDEEENPPEGSNTEIQEPENEYGNEMAYWWLNANPKIWDLSSTKIGERQTYTSYNNQKNKRRIYHYFKQVKPGDLIIGYVASPIRQIVALCKVTEKLHQSPEGEVFEFEKIEQFINPISLKTLQDLPELKGCEPIINNQGSLFKLKPQEYEIIRSIVDEQNEEPEAKQSSLPVFTIEECSQATGFPVNQVVTWLAAIERKKQAVFYGPPGTGKTFVSHLVARHIVGGGDGFIERIQFHPAWTYEDFMQGIRPETDQKGNLHFELKAGRFVEFCTRARQRKDICVLIIDELNRANIARVFGELMYLLEYREQDMPLSGGLRFSIPDNVRIIGTMNTADRSIALVDFALRRRFAFIELLPEYSILHAFQATQDVDAGGLIAVLKEVNAKIDDKNFHLGISFFMVEKLVEKLEEIWRMEIETYLEEYFFSQPSTVSGYRWDKIKDRLFA
jgi:hypothetical protein